MIKKRDKKHKFNIVDGFVVFLVLICIASIVNKALVITDKYDSNKTKDYRVEFTVENIDEVKQSAINNIKSGDTVVRHTDASAFGTIEGEITYNDDGQTAYGNLIVCGVLEERGLRLDDNSLISVGDEIVIATERAQITLKIVAIQR